MSKKDEAVAEDGQTRLEFKKLPEYVPGVSGSGKRTKNNGDEVAVALNGMTLDEVTQLASRLKVEFPDYSHLNIGMQRMNIGNKIRGAVNKANKAEEGTGSAALEDKSKTIVAKVTKRLAAAVADAEKKAKDAAAKKAADEKAASKAEAA